MEWLWLLILIPLTVAVALALKRLQRPTVAEVHSWREDADYRMVLVLNGTDLVLRAGLRLPDQEPSTIREAAAAMLGVLSKRVRFTPWTVYIPEGPGGLNAAP
ncbi:MAG: hypothetical protein ACPHID_05500 [Thermoplasmatota archaeon]